MISRRAVVHGLPMAALLPPPARAAGPDGLAAHAARAGVLFGTEATAKVLADVRYADLVGAECALVVDGADLLPVNLRPSIDRFEFASADAVVDYAARNKLAFRGHNLVWHLSQADWLPSVSTAAAGGIMERHIDTVCRRYAGRVHSWDVVNECVDPDDGNPLGLCDSPWLTLLGPDYVRMAFEIARLADPHAMLCLNEAGLEAPGRDGQRMRAAMLRFLERLLGQGAPVQALGVECHLLAGRTSVDAPALAAFLRDVGAMGLQVVISELDASDRRMAPDIAARDAAVAYAYAAVLDVALASRAVATVVTWGLSDRYSWLSIDPEVRRADGIASRGAPLGADMQPMPAYAELVRAFDRSAARR